MNNVKNQEDTLMAVIAAAVASMNRSADVKLVVKSFRRIPQTSPVWNTNGRIELHRGKLN